MKEPLPYSINCRGRLLTLDRPRIMGILNVTPDSFSDGGLYLRPDDALRRTEEMLAEGADIIDLGGYSSRPRAEDIAPETELRRVIPVAEAILARFPEMLLSIDTFRTAVAREALACGAHLINDITAGVARPGLLGSDDTMPTLVGSYGDVPYIAMHMQGSPATMQAAPSYSDVMDEVWAFFVGRIQAARQAGIRDLIIDPGFGFGKSIEHNYQLMAQLGRLRLLDHPLLVGISRKSMLYRPFGLQPGEVADLTSALHLKALEAGAGLLRVHDVAAARRIVQLYLYLQPHGTV
ncbi:MAG: dihydropteroate synthase [Bacteroidia bacterium]